MTTIIILVIAGILLVIAELVLPGGVLGIVGVICLLVAIVLSFKNGGPVVGLSVFVGVSIFCLIMTGLWMKHFRKLPVTKSLVLDGEINTSAETAELNALLGKRGVALSDIIPSGHAEIDGEKVDVMTETCSIEKGAAVKVVDVRGPSIFVDKV